MNVINFFISSINSIINKKSTIEELRDNLAACKDDDRKIAYLLSEDETGHAVFENVLGLHAIEDVRINNNHPELVKECFNSMDNKEYFFCLLNDTQENLFGSRTMAASNFFQNACLYGSPEVIETLLRLFDADDVSALLRAQDTVHQSTSLHRGIESKNIETVRVILKYLTKECKKEVMLLRDENVMTPLLAAAMTGNADIVALVYKETPEKIKEKTLKMKELDSQNVLHILARSSSLKYASCFDDLKEVWGVANHKLWEKLVNHRDSNEKTPLDLLNEHSHSFVNSRQLV